MHKTQYFAVALNSLTSRDDGNGKITIYFRNFGSKCVSVTILAMGIKYPSLNPL